MCLRCVAQQPTSVSKPAETRISFTNGNMHLPMDIHMYMYVCTVYIEGEQMYKYRLRHIHTLVSI